MNFKNFNRRLENLERLEHLKQQQAKVSIWDIFFGTVTDDVAPEDILDWDKLGPLFEEADRLVKLPDPLEVALAALDAQTQKVNPQNANAPNPKQETHTDTEL
jgi:hypothetical protein